MNELSFKKLNIGGSLTALLHAYVTETPIIIDVPHMPFELEKCPPHWDLEFLGFSSKTKINKIQVWERLTFLLSMAGLVVFPNNIKHARHESGAMILILHGNKRFKVSYQKLYSFDRDKEDALTTYDWFDVKVGSIHLHERIHDDSDFCTEVFFYPSKRNGTKKDMLDACAVSKIPTHLIDHIDYSPIYARLKVLNMMKKAGIKGKINGYDQHAKPVHLPLKIEHTHRETSQPCINLMGVEDLINKRPRKNGDLWRLTQRYNTTKIVSTLQA
jgi:hypothetical protein